MNCISLFLLRLSPGAVVRMFNILCEGSSLSSAFKVRGSYGCPSCRIGVLVPDGFFSRFAIRVCARFVCTCGHVMLGSVSIGRNLSMSSQSGFVAALRAALRPVVSGRLAPAVPALMSEQGERSCSSQRATCPASAARVAKPLRCSRWPGQACVACVSTTDSCLQILQFSSPDVGEGRKGQCSES